MNKYQDALEGILEINIGEPIKIPNENGGFVIRNIKIKDCWKISDYVDTLQELINNYTDCKKILNKQSGHLLEFDYAIDYHCKNNCKNYDLCSQRNGRVCRTKKLAQEIIENNKKIIEIYEKQNTNKGHNNE